MKVLIATKRSSDASEGLTSSVECSQGGNRRMLSKGSVLDRSQTLASSSLQIALSALIATLLTACGIAQQEPAKRTPLVARELPSDKLAIYERELFVEIMDWNGGSRRHDLWSREAEWRHRAAEGFVLAELTLEVLSPLQGPLNADDVLPKIEKIAASGDSGAMCLYPRLVPYAKGTADSLSELKERAQHWLLLGLAAGHPACQEIMGANLLLGKEVTPADASQGFALAVSAEKAGYGGAATLVAYYQKKEPNSPENLQRLVCWTTINAKYSIYSDPEVVLRNALRTAAATKDGKLTMAAEKLYGRVFSLDDCINLGLGD